MNLTFPCIFDSLTLSRVKKNCANTLVCKHVLFSFNISNLDVTKLAQYHEINYCDCWANVNCLKMQFLKLCSNQYLNYKLCADSTDTLHNSFKQELKFSDGT